MATSKTLTPTNVTIQIPEFTDQPDQRVNSNCIDKEADAINALNTKITKQTTTFSVTGGTAYLSKMGNVVHLKIEVGNSGHTSGTSIGTIPTGYRPSVGVAVPSCTVSDTQFTSLYPCTCVIGADGSVTPMYGNGQKGIVLYVSATYFT